MLPNKKAIQDENETLKREIEQWKSENETLKRNIESLKDTTSQQDKRIDSLNTAISEYKTEANNAKKQADEFKKEIESLTDTKAVLDRLMSIFRNPHNDYQKVINELNDMLSQERIRTNALEQELRNIQFDIQHNKFLDGKVQAYETILKARPVTFSVNPWEHEEERGL